MLGFAPLSAAPISSASDLTSYTLIASPTTYIVVAIDATLSKTYKLTASSTAYVVSGTAVQFGKNDRRLTASGAAYTVSGTSATLGKTQVLSADPHIVYWEGTDASLKTAYVLSADNSTVVWDRSAALFRKGRTLTASGATYVVSGTAARYSPRLVVSGAVFHVAGSLSEFIAPASTDLTWTNADGLIVKFGKSLVDPWEGVDRTELVGRQRYDRPSSYTRVF